MVGGLGVRPDGNVFVLDDALRGAATGAPAGERSAPSSTRRSSPSRRTAASSVS